MRNEPGVCRALSAKDRRQGRYCYDTAMKDRNQALTAERLDREARLPVRASRAVRLSYPLPLVGREARLPVRGAAGRPGFALAARLLYRTRSRWSLAVLWPPAALRISAGAYKRRSGVGAGKYLKL